MNLLEYRVRALVRPALRCARMLLIMFAVAALVAAAAVCYCYILPFAAERRVMAALEGDGALIRTEAGAPPWVGRLLGEGNIQQVVRAELPNRGMSDENIHRLTQLRAPRTLIVSGRGFTNVQARRLRSIPSLRVLVLDSTRATDSVARWLRWVNPRLVVFRSEHTAIATLRWRGVEVMVAPHGDRRLHEQLGRRHFQHAVWVFADDTPLDDRDLVHLQSLGKLRWLSLRGTRVTDQGMPLVARLETLEELDLEGTEITDAGLALLARLTRLQTIDLRSTSVTAEGIARFQESLPYVHVNRYRPDEINVAAG